MRFPNCRALSCKPVPFDTSYQQKMRTIERSASRPSPSPQVPFQRYSMMRQNVLDRAIHELYCVKPAGASEANMKSQYVATLRQNPGRQALSVEFRHPLRPDPSNQGKPGRKVRKGLGTDRVAAERLVAELNGLLADPTLHSPAARAKAEENLKDPRIIEIFYDGIEPKRENSRDLRNDHLPFPPREDGYPRILLIGVPGAGKTTLVLAANWLAPRPRSVSFDFR